jgi:ABC-2 type transport system permease protein
LLLVLLSALPVLLAVAFRMGGETDIERFTRRIFDTITLTILLPLVAILFGAGAFGAEIDDGTVVYLLAKPISRWLVVAAKAFAAVAMSIALTGTSTLVAGLVDLAPAGQDGISAVLAQVVAVVVGSVCYAVLFLTLSLFTRRALVIGIGYMLVWEGALSFILTGIANLSIRQYALGASKVVYELPLQEARLSAETAWVLASVLVIAALVIATWKLMRFELPGGSD